jgi:hypothetical protein
VTALLAQEVPGDPRIPALEALSTEGASSLLSRAGFPADAVGISVLKHHRGARCALRIETSRGPVVLKAFHRDPAPLIEVMDALDKEGLASGRPPTAAPLLGFDTSLRFLVIAWLDGPRARDMLDGDGTGERVGELGAMWLRRASTSGIKMGDRWGPERMGDEIARWVRLLDEADGELGSKAKNVQKQLSAIRTSQDRYLLCHGSFSPSHVFDMGEGPGLIDWDSFCLAPLELDGGRFLANLSRLVVGGSSANVEADRAVQAFRAGIADLADHKSLEWHRAAMQLKVAMHLAKRRSSRWEERAGLIMDDAGRALDALA